jgi:hypothetical protein
MRLSKFLFEEGRGNYIDEEEAILIAKKNCMESINKYITFNFNLYRGFTSYDPFYLIDPKLSNRVSAVAPGNFYTLLMDNLPSWKKYPKRSKSIICTTSIRNASDYGTLGVVFPFNKARLGVCPASDIWDSFDIGLYEFNTNLLYIINNLIEIPSKGHIKDMTWKELLSFFEQIDEERDKKNPKIEGIMFGVLPAKYRDKYFNSNIPLIKIVTEIFNPKKFVLKTTTSTLTEDDKEVWTDSKSLIVDYSYVDDFIKKVK